MDSTSVRLKQQLKGAAMKERILVVDDQRDIADALVRLLETLGYEAMAVYGGRSAADEAANFLPDMAFIDLSMPGLDGFQTVARIRGHRECAHAILVAFTGRADLEAKHRAYEAGFDLHVAKPVNIDKLMELLALVDPKASNMSPAGRVYRLASAWQEAKGA
jgi:CheY-like chemotaxis protein